MGTRSLFNANTGAHAGTFGLGRSMGSIFAPRLGVNPDYSEETADSVPLFVSHGGIFGSGKRMADAANADLLAKKVLAKYGMGLEVEKTRKINKLKKDEEEEELGDMGMALGQNMGAMSPDEVSKIFPPEQTFRTPQEQMRAYNQKFGEKTPLAQAPQKYFMNFGSGDLYNPTKNTFVNSGKTVYDESIIKGKVATGEMVPGYNPDGTMMRNPDGTIKMVPEMKEQEKTIRTPREVPPNEGMVRPIVTQGVLDKIPKTPNSNTATYPSQGFNTGGMMGSNYNPRVTTAKPINVPTPIPSSMPSRSSLMNVPPTISNVPAQPVEPPVRDFNQRINDANSMPEGSGFDTLLNTILPGIVPQEQSAQPTTIPTNPIGAPSTINQSPPPPPAVITNPQPVVPPTSPVTTAKPYNDVVNQIMQMVQNPETNNELFVPSYDATGQDQYLASKLFNGTPPNPYEYNRNRDIYSGGNSADSIGLGDYIRQVNERLKPEARRNPNVKLKNDYKENRISVAPVTTGKEAEYSGGKSSNITNLYQALLQANKGLRPNYTPPPEEEKSGREQAIRRFMKIKKNFNLH